MNTFKPKRGDLLVVGSALLHAALLTLLFKAEVTPPAPLDDAAISVSLLQVSAPAMPQVETALTAPAPIRSPEPLPKAAESPPPEDLPPQFVDISFAEPPIVDRSTPDDPVALSVAASAAAGTPCQLGQWLQTALQADPQTRAALTHIPRPSRSLANAIMVWDGDWVATESRAFLGMVAIRDAILAGVRAAPAACRDQPIQGPELLLLADGAQTTVIVVGSGAWRWADLLREEPASPTWDLRAGGAPLS